MKASLCILLIACLALVSGCGIFPRTQGEVRSGYTYVPIDPFSVEVVDGKTTNHLTVTLASTNVVSLIEPNVVRIGGTNLITLDGTNILTWTGTNDVSSKGTTVVSLADTNMFRVIGTNIIRLIGSNLLDSLPDNAVRIAVEQYDADGNVSYGPAKVSVAGATYKVTIDYINADTANVRFFLAKRVIEKLPKSTWQHTFGTAWAARTPHWISISAPSPQYMVRGTDEYFVKRVDSGPLPGTDLEGVDNSEILDFKKHVAEYNLPIYVGIGLRVTAYISSIKGNVNLSGLGGIGLAASANRVSGSLVVQTLGINGKSIAPSLPMQSELNQSTIQNAIVSVASIKTHLYDPDTTKSPRVVGLYLPFAGAKPLVNAIISELSKHPVQWDGYCKQ